MFSILLAGCGGGGSATQQPPANPPSPAPSIGSIAPPNATVGGPMTITVNGTNFANGAVVQWNGTNLATTFVSSTQLTAVVPGSLLATAGTAQVRVVNPGSAASTAVAFAIQNGVPVIASLSPASVSAGGPPLTLTISGSSFVSGAIVYWNKSTLPTTFVDNGQLTVTVPSNMLANAGIIQISAENPSPGGGISNSASFSLESTVVKFAYVAHYQNDAISMYVRDASGEMRYNGYVMAGDQPYYIVTELTKRFAYVVNYGSNNVSAYAIQPSGHLKEIAGSPFPSGGGLGAWTIEIDPSNNFLLLTNYDSNDVSVLRIDHATGALTAVQGSPFPSGSYPCSPTFDPTGKFAFVPNNGSNTVSAYMFNAQTGTLTPVPNSPYSGVAAPIDVAVSPSGRFLYVVNDEQAGSVSIFSINPATGELTPGPAPVAVGSYPQAMLFSADGSFGYVVNLESQNISAFSVNYGDGSLTAVPGSPFALPANKYPVSGQLDNAGRTLFVSDVGPLHTTMTIFDVDPATGSLTLSSQIKTMDRQIALSLVEGPSAANFAPELTYTIDAVNNSLSSFKVDSISGALTPVAAISTQLAPRAMAVHPLGRYVYVANSSSNTLSVFTSDPSTGVLAAAGAAVATGQNPQSVAIEPSGRFLYVVNSGSNSVSIYSINASTGVLAASGSVATGTTPVSITIDPTVRWAYVTNPGSNNIYVYAIDLASGALTHRMTKAIANSSPALASVDVKARALNVLNSAQLASYRIYMPHGDLNGNGTASAGAAPSALTLEPSGRFAYVAAAGSNEVRVFSLDATTATPTFIGAIQTGPNPSSLAVDPSGKFLYVATAGSGELSVFAIDAFSGLLTLKSTVPGLSVTTIQVSGSIQ